MDLTLPFLICFLTSPLVQTLHLHWSYTRQDEWPGPCHSGKQQSPIVLPTNKRLVSLQHYEKIKFRNYDVPFQGIISNSGHSVVIHLQNKTSRPRSRPSISGGGLSDEYYLQQFHFHWGGAEHLIDNHRYPAEAHFVHYAKKYGNYKHASKHKGGIAVLGIFYDELKRENPAFKVIAEKIPNIEKYGSKGLPLKVVLKDFFPEKLDTYYRYKGSLTTPRCDEVVIWTVFEQPSYISPSQLSPFFKVQSQEGEPVKFNYGKIQPLNGRTLYYNNNE